MYTISTQTFIVYTDIGKLNLESRFDAITPTKEVIGIKLGALLKGEFNRPQTIPSTKNFLKCITLNIRVDPKKTISCKLFSNGTIQLTGCKDESHAHFCIDKIFSILHIDTGVFHLQSVMLNVTFNLGKEIDKYKLAQHLYETSRINIPPVVSTGLKFKAPIIHEVAIPSFKWENGSQCYLGDVDYKTFFASCSKKTHRIFTTSVTVYETGKVSLSAVDKNAIAQTIAWLESITSTSWDIIGVKHREKKTFYR